ncbi:MAG: hypothetical protein IJI21_02285 [Clostridia bacterium]|nr:hypothetical protein [Clostridia bacterium]
MRSPEELDTYIRIVSPGTLILVTALALVLAALMIWGCTGTLPVTKRASGVMISIENRRENARAYDGRIIFAEKQNLPAEELRRCDACFFLNAHEFSGDELTGRDVIISRPGKNAVRGVVASVEPVPYTREEILSEFGSRWVVDSCVESDYSWVVTARLDGNEYDQSRTLVDVTIVTDNVRPISFLLR